MVAVRTAHVAADPARVLGNRGEACDTGQAGWVAECGQVATSAGDQLGAEKGANAGHAHDGLGVLVLAEPVPDERVDARDLGVQVHDRAGRCVDHGGCGLLAGELGVLA